MSDAPENIWAVHWNTEGAVMNGAWADTIRHFGGGVEYTRSDLAQAMVAKAREDALDSVLKEVEGYLPEFGAGEPQDGADRIIDQCWRDFRKVVKALIDRTAEGEA